MRWQPPVSNQEPKNMAGIPRTKPSVASTIWLLFARESGIWRRWLIWRNKGFHGWADQPVKNGCLCRFDQGMTEHGEEELQLDLTPIKLQRWTLWVYVMSASHFLEETG